MARGDPMMRIRAPEGLHDRLKAAAAANHRSMNSEIVARLLASFDDDASEPEAAPMSSNLRTGRGDKQFMLRFPDGMHDAVKAQADANGRTINAEIIVILSAALSGGDDRLVRIEAKLDELLSGRAA